MLPLYLMFSATIILMAAALFYLNRNKDEKIFVDLAYKLTALQAEIQRIENAVKTEIAVNRRETLAGAANARNELTNSLTAFKHDLAESIQQFNNIQKDNFF